VLASVYGRVVRALARHAGLRAFRFFRRELDPATAAKVPAGVEVRMLAEGDLARVCHRPQLDLSAEKVAAAFARGDLCAGAYDSGELVAYCWFAFAPAPHLDGAWADFHRQGVWIYKSLVLPSHRGRGIAPALYRFTDPRCVERGRKFSICCIESHNRPSLAAIRRAGYESAGYAGYLRRGRTILPVTSPAASRMEVRFFIPA
jgi:GNAT superfamily N-acetyltransferase